MSSRSRYVGGDTNKVAYKPNPLYPFEKGDLLFLHTDGMLRPASALNAEGTAALDQLGFAKHFVGVADEKYGAQSGETLFHLNGLLSPQVSVCQSGRFEFPCDAQTLTLAPVPMGIYSDGAGIDDSQKVDTLQGAAALAQSIGVLHVTEGLINAAGVATRCVVDIMARKAWETTDVAGDYTGTSGQ